MLQSPFRTTPSKDSVIKIVQPVSRTKMPNFASLHKKQFEQMESLVQNKARKEERAKQLFSATTPNYMKSDYSMSIMRFYRLGVRSVFLIDRDCYSTSIITKYSFVNPIVVFVILISHKTSVQWTFGLFSPI